MRGAATADWTEVNYGLGPDVGQCWTPEQTAAALQTWQRSRIVDPENRLLTRMNRQRLEAETIRDCLLAVFPAIPYCVDLIEGPFLTTHESVVKVFRPKK